MSPKEFFVDKIADWFARHGVNALLYDARTLGASDGLPRSDLDPQKMAEDNSDAVTVRFHVMGVLISLQSSILIR